MRLWNHFKNREKNIILAVIAIIFFSFLAHHFFIKPVAVQSRFVKSEKPTLFYPDAVLFITPSFFAPQVIMEMKQYSTLQDKFSLNQPFYLRKSFDNLNDFLIVNKLTRSPWLFSKLIQRQKKTIKNENNKQNQAGIYLFPQRMNTVALSHIIAQGPNARIFQLTENLTKQELIEELSKLFVDFVNSGQDLELSLEKYRRQGFDKLAAYYSIEKAQLCFIPGFYFLANLAYLEKKKTIATSTLVFDHAVDFAHLDDQGLLHYQFLDLVQQLMAKVEISLRTINPEIIFKNSSIKQKIQFPFLPASNNWVGKNINYF